MEPQRKQELLARKEEMSASRNRSVVLIVGAGVAGLAAARRLRENSVDSVVVLEGSHRPGGRVCSHSLRQGEGECRG